eukprot:753776_1
MVALWSENFAKHHNNTKNFLDNMSILSFLSLCSFFWIHIVESSNIAQATFHLSNTGIDGFFAMYNGKFWYDLDFTNFNFSLLPDNCTEGGLKFDLHTDWTYNEDEGDLPADRMLDACHSNFTGGSYDPWFACGPHSSSPDCIVNGGCIPPSSVFAESDLFEGGYTCDKDNYDLVAYTCESGDWSGKYGLLFPDYYDNDTNETEGEVLLEYFTSYWELQEELLMDFNTAAFFSLVIHCSDGTPALCAPIVREQTNNIPDITLDDTEVIQISFEEAGSEFDNFTVTWNNQGLEFNIPQSVGDLCEQWYLRLYETYPYGEGIDAVEAEIDCDVDGFGGIYDPTHSCVEDSGSLYCKDGVRCNTTAANYDCSGDFRGCAVGDISARIGSIVYDPLVGGTQKIQLADPQSPPLFILDARGIVMECMENTTISNVCSGTVCDNCTSLAPVNNMTAAPTSQTLVPSTSPTDQPTTASPTKAPTRLETTGNENDQGKPKQGMETGAVVGIVVGAVVFLILIGVLVYCVVIKSKGNDNQRRSSEDQLEMNKMKSASADGDEADTLKA